MSEQQINSESSARPPVGIRDSVSLNSPRAGAAASHVVSRGFRVSRWLHAFIRWLHIYSSLLGFLTVLFFSVTGLTLNHPEWFDSGFEQLQEGTGQLEKALLGSESQEPDDLRIVEFIRTTHHVTASLKDLQTDDEQINVAFAGPGYTCDVRIDRNTGEYQYSELRLGVIPIINDLHKGRDTGPVWSIVIDVSAVLLVFISATGLILLCWLRRRWRAGLLTLAVGIASLLVPLWFSLA